MACSLALFNIVISIASLMAIELPPEIHFYQNVSNPFFKPAPISGTAKYLLLWADVRTAILEAHEEVCGETRLCTSKEDDKLSRSKCSVCETCFCDDMCQHYGDCCIDKIIDDHLLDEPVYLTDKVPGPLYSECMDVRVKAHRIDSNSEFSQHRLISKCPDKWPDPILRSECEDTGPINARVLRRDITLEQLSQNWPVASNRTSVFYKNRACASCHGDAEEGSLIFWKLKLSYEDFPELGPSAEPRVLLEAFLKDSSTEVSFTVPDGMDARPCQFVLVKHSDIIGKCNMTGFRYLYDPVLWKSCELFPTLFKVFGDYFANMFCYWCQYDDKMPASSTCYSGIPFPFFVILSPDAVQSIHDARQNFDCRCRDGFLYDPYKVNCRRLHCATGKTLRNGECLSSVDVGKGQYYSLSLTMTSRWPVEDMSDPVYPSNMETFLKITELLKSTVARTLFTKEQDVNLDTFFIHISQVTNKQQEFNISIYTEMKTIAEENQDTLETRLMSVHNHTWNLKLPSLQSNISLTSIITERPKKNVLQRCDIGFWSSPIKESSPNISHPRHDFYMCFQEIVIHPRRFRGVASENTETKVIAYKEVKNTLNCPHFIYNLTNTTEAKLKNMNDNSEWPHSLEVLVHVSTGVELSTLYYTHTSEGLVMVCVDKIQEKMKLDYEEDRGGVDGVDVFGLGLVVTSHVCLGISIICLSLTLLTYCLLPSLRTLPGKNTMCLVASLLLAIVLFFVGGFVQESSLECQIIGMLTHFFILSTFVWMLICTIHMHRVFSDVLKHTQSGDGENNGKFIVYAVVSIVVSGVIVLVTVVANYIFTSFSDSNDSTTDYQLDNATDLTEIDSVHNSCETDSRVRFGYGNGICYLSNKLSLLLAGALPIVVSCAANLVIFTFTILAFRTMSLQEKVARKEKRGHLLIYIKLSTLTGINWLPCTIAAFVSSPVVWFAFLILCGLQGLYVFTSFVCNKRVLNLCRHRITETTTNSTSSSQGRKAKSQRTAMIKCADKQLASNTTSLNSNSSSRAQNA